MKIKANLRNFWTSENDAVNDFVNGNVVIAQVWNAGYWHIKTHPKMKGRNIKYMQPVEGRLVWVCGTILSAASKQPGRAMTAMASIDTPQAGAALTNDFAYASAQKDGVSKLITDKEIVAAFGLDDATLWAPPKAWPQKAVEPYKEYISAGQEVIDS